jgi:hypothetical protein
MRLDRSILSDISLRIAVKGNRPSPPPHDRQTASQQPSLIAFANGMHWLLTESSEFTRRDKLNEPQEYIALASRADATQLDLHSQA